MTMDAMTIRGALLASAVTVGFAAGAWAQTTPGSNAPGIQAQQVNPSPMAPGTRAGDAPGMGGTVGGANNVPPASQARQANPAPMPQGANQATGSGMGMGGSPQIVGSGQSTSGMTLQGTGPVTAQGGTNPDRGIPGGTGAQAPSAQPDVGRGTAPGAAGAAVRPVAPGIAQNTTTGATTDPTTSPSSGTTSSTIPGTSAGAPSAGATGATSAPGAATGTTTPGGAVQGGGSASTTPPAATTQHTEPRTAAAPVPGSNSFTEGQARGRMGDAGFNDVQELRLDDQGIWRGRGMRNGQQTGIALDFQGNVVAVQ